MKLKIETYDEVCHPKVSVVCAKEASGEMISSISADSVDVNSMVENSISPKSEVAEQIEVENAEPTILMDVVEKTNNPKRAGRGRKRWYARVGTLAVGVVVMCAVALVGMRLAGFRTFTVMSGSMEPNLPVGAMIYVKPVDYKTLKVGDVISYVAGDDKTIVTHRIDEIEVDGADANVLRFRTKGDANATADSKLVHYKNVLGTPIITIPFIGYFAHNIQQPPGVYIALVVGTLLLAWTFLPGTLEERRKTARKSIA